MKDTHCRDYSKRMKVQRCAICNKPISYLIVRRDTEACTSCIKVLVDLSKAVRNMFKDWSPEALEKLKSFISAGENKMSGLYINICKKCGCKWGRTEPKRLEFASKAQERRYMSYHKMCPSCGSTQYEEETNGEPKE